MHVCPTKGCGTGNVCVPDEYTYYGESCCALQPRVVTTPDVPSAVDALGTVCITDTAWRTCCSLNQHVRSQGRAT